MLKKLLIFWVFLFIYPFIGITQDIQYYISVADTTHNTTLKLEALDSVLSKSFRKNNNTFIAFSIQYIELAKGIDSINLAAKKAMNLQNILSVAKNNPRKAIKIIDGVLAHKYKIKDSFLLGGLYLKRGSANYKLDLKKAINDYSKAIEFFTKNDSIYVADAYLFRGQAYSNLGKFVPAGEDYKNAYAYFENLKDYEYMLYSQQGNITMYSMNGFFEKAKLERDVLIDKLIELDLEKYIPIEFYNQALDYKKMGKKELQLNSLLDAEKYLGIANSDSHNIINYVIVHSLLAEYYSEEYEFEKASEHIKLVEKVKEKFEGDYLADSNYFGAKAVFFRTSEDYKTALKYAQKKLESARSLNYEEEIMESHLLLSSIYVKMGDFKNSLKNKNAYSAIKDSIFNRSTANSLAYYQTLYEIEKKEKELVEKNTNIRLLEKDNQYFKKFNIFISIALLLLFGVFLLYRNQRSLKTKKNLQEKFSQE